MCYTEEDDELWQEDPYEFIRVKYGEEQYISRGNPPEVRVTIEHIRMCKLHTLERVKEVGSLVGLNTSLEQMGISVLVKQHSQTTGHSIDPNILPAF